LFIDSSPTETTSMNIKKQSGAVLVVSMILLLILTVTSFSMIQSSNFYENMSSNYQDREVSFQLAQG